MRDRRICPERRVPERAHTRPLALTRALRALRSTALVIGLAGLPMAGAMAADPAVLAKSGSGDIVACASCHGESGEGMASFPRLAGLNAQYLARQMTSISDGTRENAVMLPIVTALGEQGIRQMADYYSALPVPVSTGEVPGDDSPGARLALRGDWDRNIPACVACHGPGGRGVGEHFPALAGQLPGYLVSQLKAWKDGARKNDPLELMRHLSSKLSDAEMRDVAAWFAGQPASAPAVAKEQKP